MLTNICTTAKNITGTYRSRFLKNKIPVYIPVECTGNLLFPTRSFVLPYQVPGTIVYEKAVHETILLTTDSHKSKHSEENECCEENLECYKREWNSFPGTGSWGFLESSSSPHGIRLPDGTKFLGCTPFPGTENM